MWEGIDVFILALAPLQVVPTGLQHGTITAVIDHEPYEITTLRIDTDHDGAFVTTLTRGGIRCCLPLLISFAFVAACHC